MTRSQSPEAKLVRPAVNLFVENALRHDDSLFTPGQPVWSLANLDDFHRRFVKNPDESSETFLVKLKEQLAGAPAATVQLAAECVYVYFLVPQRVWMETKQDNVETVLSWSPESVAVPAALLTALGGGIVTSGGYSTYKPYLITYLIELTQKLKRLSADDRDRALDEHQQWRKIAHSFSVRDSLPMREALLHLVHPDTFEPIVSSAAKSRIAAAFADQVTSTGLNVDEKLLEIRRSLADEHGPDVGFFDPAIRDRWQPEASRWGQFVMWAKRFAEDPRYDVDERNYKQQIVENVRKARRVFLARDADWYDALKKSFGSPNNLTNFRTHGTFLDWVREDGKAGAAALEAIWDSRSTVEERIRRFSQLFPTSVVPGPGVRLNLASFLNLAHDPETEPSYKYKAFHKAFKLTGEPRPNRDLDEAATYRHALDFLDLFNEKAAELGLMLRDRLDAESAIWCLTSWQPKHWKEKDRVALQKYRDSRGLLPEENGGKVSIKDESLGQLADRLYLDEGFLREIRTLLEVKRQVIFQGPPGTGKTFVARALADFFAGGNHDAVRLVQFHPSYAYEDFIEGFRPSKDGQGFVLRPGPLKRIAEAATNHSDIHVLIIDEINRGNLAKIFGELYFLLEYRTQDVTLQYSEKPFSLPENLWIIGTMNTADRSIALVDAALRRRFHFVDFNPQAPPIDGLLRHWLAANRPEMSWVADVVDRANTLLDDRDLAIGPSYFLDTNLSEEWVELIWKHSILPYVAEQLFDEPDRLAEFDLKRLRSAAAEDESTDKP